MNIIKFLQAQGIGSRKFCKIIVHSGRVRLDNEIIHDEKKEINPQSINSLMIDDKTYQLVPLPFFYIVLNKPDHYETSHKPKSYPSIFSLLPDHIRSLDLQAVGRLDEDTTGLLIITNDGKFNHFLTSPKSKIEKVYQATLKHPADENLCQQLIDGVMLHDEHELIRANSAKVLDGRKIEIILYGGKYHQVKRMIAAAGNRVISLKRTRFAQYELGELPLAEWKLVQSNEIFNNELK